MIVIKGIDLLYIHIVRYVYPSQFSCEKTVSFIVSCNFNSYSYFQHQNCSEKFEKLTETAKRAEQALAESRESWSRQEEIFVKETEALKQRLKDLEECNRNLHEQLDVVINTFIYFFKQIVFQHTNYIILY